MDISKAVSALFSSEKKEGNETIEHGFLTSSRFLVMVGMVGLLLWLVLKGMTDLKLILPITGIAALYIVTNTVTRIYQIKENGQIIRERQRLAWADGVLTPAEAAALDGADSKSSSVSNVISA